MSMMADKKVGKETFVPIYDSIHKSTLIRKLEAGDRNIYREYIAFCNYKGKRHAMLLKRRKAEFALLYVP